MMQLKKNLLSLVLSILRCIVWMVGWYVWLSFFLNCTVEHMPVICRNMFILEVGARNEVTPELTAVQYKVSESHSAIPVQARFLISIHSIAS